MQNKLLRLTLALSLLSTVVFAVYQETAYAQDPPTEEQTEDASSSDAPLLIRSRRLFLLQPLDDATRWLDASPGIDIFFTYFNMSWPWVLGVAAGVGVLQALIGGVEIMLSGSDSGMRENGKSKIMWALAGMLMVGLAGFILRSLNPIFYT
ncbi:pilin [Candidatus Peribacteria bacterium]|nr:MAG: pilin [Candidatus Peribacteria bacterium]